MPTDVKWVFRIVIVARINYDNSIHLEQSRENIKWDWYISNLIKDTVNAKMIVL